MAEKYPRERKALRKNIGALGNGTVLFIDPASKDAGWAISEGGKVIESGSIHAKGHIAERLEHMSMSIMYLAAIKPFDLVVVEKVRGPRGHIMLLWSVGVAIAASGAPISLEVTTNMWSEAKDDYYVKGDEADALYLAKWTLGFARGDYL